ncbi:hypothetical protein CQW23_28759 [Capsicum baccatum]|uniref:Uncharacterized protein n=1 Tax=Capsicum baccatum TaxID=33114 RepID=A0A2G2VHH9_CAPBA|nr:hypothetical protein CQW23_28759 [Capsicum baccatum]
MQNKVNVAKVRTNLWTQWFSQVESEAEKNSSNRETLLQPSDQVVHCELKKLEIHRAPPIDAQTQLIPTINPVHQLKGLSGQGNKILNPTKSHHSLN